MAEGHHEGKDVSHPDIRALFGKDALLASDWYHERLRIKQQRDAALFRRHVEYLTAFLREADTRCEPDHSSECLARLEHARSRLAEIESPAYLDSLSGSLGADWVHRTVAA